MMNVGKRAIGEKAIGEKAIGGNRFHARPSSITLDVTPEMMATLQQMSRDSGQPLDVVFTRAIGLYKAALEATAEGKHVGYAASSDPLEVEFTGLLRPEAR